jgi:uncharacterized membrane protein YfhO
MPRLRQNNNWFVQKNTNALPPALLVDNYEFITNDKQILQRIFSQSFNPEKTVIIEKPVQLKNNIADSGHESVSIKKYSENNILLNSSTETTRILLLLDNYYPGWKAYVDNKETEIFRTDYTFRGIILPKGNHTVIFTYQPDSVRYGIYISVIAAIIYFLCLILVFKSMFYKRP